jgi:hypothetical protein
MRDYIGVDWADADHAVWVEDELGTKIMSRSVPQTVDGLGEFGHWLMTLANQPNAERADSTRAEPVTQLCGIH